MTTRHSNSPAATCRVVDAEISFRRRTLLRPLVLSSGTIESATEVQAIVTVETIAGRRGRGRGTIYLSDVWAWPDPKVPPHIRIQTLTQFAEEIANQLPGLESGDFHHPLQLGLRMHEWACNELPADHTIPSLARAMCVSPFDAAIHDAAGIALGLSAFDLYVEDAAVDTADPYFPLGGVVAAIRRLLQPARKELLAWLIVSPADALPDAIAGPCQRHGFRCFKLKISGRDNQADVEQTVNVFRAARQLGIVNPQLTVDSNEANPDALSVLDYLERLEKLDADAYRALAYVEQPTARDILTRPFDWRPVASRKPVMLDEGLTDMSVLELAYRQGWSGLALKTCKGHSMLMATAAWAYEHGMLLSLQDLTNPGIALLHAALVGSRLPTINGAELNSPQFTPQANQEFLPRLSALFEPRDGVHCLPEKTPLGLGSKLAYSECNFSEFAQTD